MGVGVEDPRHTSRGYNIFRLLEQRSPRKDGMIKSVREEDDNVTWRVSKQMSISGGVRMKGNLLELHTDIREDQFPPLKSTTTEDRAEIVLAITMHPRG